MLNAVGSAAGAATYYHTPLLFAIPVPCVKTARRRHLDRRLSPRRGRDLRGPHSHERKKPLNMPIHRKIFPPPKPPAPRRRQS